MQIKSIQFLLFAIGLLTFLNGVDTSNIVIKRCASVASFTLVDAKTHRDIGTLLDVIKLYDYASDAVFNIRVNVKDTACRRHIRSVLITYTSTAEPTRHVCENWLPFTVFGDKNPRALDLTDYSNALYVQHQFPNVKANATLHVTPFFRRDCHGNVRGRIKHQFFKVEPRECFKWQQLGHDINGEANADHSGVVALSADGKVMAIGSPYHSGILWDSGRVRLWTWDPSKDIWIRIGQNIDGEGAGDQSSMANALAISNDGNTVAIGSWLNGEQRGHVRVWRMDNSSWQWVQLGQDIDGNAIGDQSGYSLDISGDANVVVIGAPMHDGEIGRDSGQVRVWQFDGLARKWVQLGQDIDGTQQLFQLGTAVAISGDGKTVASSALFQDSAGYNKGLVRVWRWYGESDPTWKQLGKDLHGDVENNAFGASLAMSSDGKILAVGDYWTSSNFVGTSGRAKVFGWNDTLETWTQMGQDINGEVENAFSGWDIDIALDGKTIAIGSPDENGMNGVNSGRVLVWSWNENKRLWMQIGQHIDGENASDEFGKSVALTADGTIVAVGAYRNSNVNGLESGQVRVWQRVSTTCDAIGQ